MELPREWKEVKLGSIMNFKNGLNFSQDSNGKKLNFLGVGNFRNKKVISSESELDSIFISEFPDDDFLLKKDDLVFVRSNGSKELVGRCVKMNDSFSRTTFSGFCIRGRLESEVTSSDYLLYLIECGFLREKLKKESRGTNISNLNQDMLNNFEIVLPPLAEQKKIAETLSVWDSAIEKMEKLIGAKQSCFNNLLNELIYSPAKDEKWKSAKLGEISEMGSGGTPKSSVEEYYNGDILWVSIADMTEQGMYISDTAKKLTKAGIENSSAKIYPAGTVLYAMYASIGEVSIASVDMSSSQAILGIQVGKNLRNKYLYYFLVGQKDHIKLQGQSGTQSNLNAGMVRNFDIPLPSLNKQDEIVDFLDSNMRELSLLKQQLALCKKQKQGLMQKLLTGEWRVK